MSIGIFTPVAGSNVRKVMDVIHATAFASHKLDFAPVAGTHLLIQPEGCKPVYYSAAEPASEAAGYTGVPIFPGASFVVPRTAACWIFNPHETQAINVTVGTLT